MSSLKTENKVRESNFELLRIIAMFMVLILHADFQALGAPDKIEIINHPMAATIKVLFEMASIVAVNVFVLISGWFGIRPSFQGISKFIFQCLFFSLGIYTVVLIKGDVQFSIRGLADCFAMMGGGYWFITSYICLYILSPVLNAFMDNTEKNTYRWVLIAFFVFQTIYAFCSGGASFFVKGYSAMSFIGLYMLAGYFKRYVDISKYSRKIWPCVYIACTLFLTLFFISAEFYGISAISSRLTIYTNPIVILSSLSLLLMFAKVRIQSRVINWIGASSFAVYLLHTNSNIYITYYIKGVQNLVHGYTLLSFILVIAYIVLWYFLAILIDKLRSVLYDFIFRSNRYKLRMNT